MRRYLSPTLVALLFFLVAIWPAVAEAQRRGSLRGPVVRSVVVFGTYGPAYWHFDQRYPYPRYPYPRYPYAYRYEERSAAVRIEVEPRDAQVYVDGYFAGLVDDFDGVFQRLQVRPGPHEIVVHLEGFQQIREDVYANAGATVRIRGTLRPVAPGEPAPIRPVPAEPPASAEPRQGPPRPEPERRAAPERRVERPVAFGTLSLLVQPADAQIFIDGEAWAAPGGTGRVSIELSPGRHRLEVRREGAQTYQEDILIRPGATMTLNVSLKGG